MLYVDDGSVITSAGSVAAIDCCLHIVRLRHGADVANRVAHMLVTPPHRQGGQAQYIEQPVPALPSENRLPGVLEWAREHRRFLSQIGPSSPSEVNHRWSRMPVVSTGAQELPRPQLAVQMMSGQAEISASHCCSVSGVSPSRRCALVFCVMALAAACACA